MTISNDGPRRPKAPPLPPARQDAGPRRRSAAAKGGRLRFAATDEVAHFGRKDAASQLQRGGRQPAKPAAAYDETAAAGCLSIWVYGGNVHVVWPSEQRYEGPVNARGAPDGTGKLQLAGDVWVRRTTWRDGTCITIEGLPSVPKQTEPYLPPAARRPPVRTRARGSLGAPPAAQADEKLAKPRGTGVLRKLFGRKEDKLQG